MIDIFPNSLDGAPCETHAIEKRMTILSFLNSILSAPLEDCEPLAIKVMVEGEIVATENWGSFTFKPSDYVEIRIEPRGIVAAVIAGTLLATAIVVSRALMPALPGTPTSPGQGKGLATSDVRGNKVKLGQPIREAFGRNKIYGDYLVPPVKRFTDADTQWTSLFLNIGKGKFQISANNIRIGDTPLASLGLDATYEIFEPGANVSGNTASEWWHSAAEVGASSTGAAGLELTFSSNITQAATSNIFQFNGYSVTIPDGQGLFPADWTVGLVLRIVAPYSYDITEAGASRDIISGPLEMLNPSIGQRIEVSGNNDGIYFVHSYTPGSPAQMTLNYEWGDPATDLLPGSGAAAIGPAGLRFKITSISPSVITVDRLLDNGSVDTGFPGFNPLTSSISTVELDAISGTGGWRGPFAAVPAKEVTSLVEVDVFLPSGLAGFDKKGRLLARTAAYEIQYRKLGSNSAWTSVTFSHSAATIDQIAYTEKFAISPPMCPEVRIRKLGPTEPWVNERGTIQWYGLRGKIDRAPKSYSGCTTLAVHVRSNDRIAAQTESLVWVEATRILPVRENGVLLPDQPTRAIAPVAEYVSKSLGYSEDMIDLAELNRLALIWNARQDWFDNQYTEQSTGAEVLNQIFNAGFSELTLERGKIRPVRDEPRTVFEQMYSAQNMSAPLKIDREILNPSDFDGVQVSYTDINTWTESTVDCKLPGDAFLKVEKISAVGITSRLKAYQLGMRRRRIQRYRTDSFSWSTELDALVSGSRYLSYCAVSDDVPSRSQSSLLVGYTSGNGMVLLESSEPLDWSKSGPYSVALRKPDGTVSGPYTAARVDDYRLTVPLIDFVPDVSWNIEPPHIMFGPVETWTYPVLITNISPQGVTGASVEAVCYDDRVYLSDNEPLP